MFFSEYHNYFSSRVMKTFKFSLVLRTRENTNVFISLDDNIYGIHSKRINILYIPTGLRIAPILEAISRSDHLIFMVGAGGGGRGLGGGGGGAGGKIL